MNNNVENLKTQNELMQEALFKIANGIVPKEIKLQWMDLSEEAYFECKLEYFQELAREAIEYNSSEIHE